MKKSNANTISLHKLLASPLTSLVLSVILLTVGALLSFLSENGMKMFAGNAANTTYSEESSGTSEPVVVGSMAVFATPYAAKLETISSDLGVSSSWLEAVFEMESGNNPQAVNPNSGATGLIQFLPSTAAALGTTTDRLRTMSAQHQLEYVYAYLDQQRGRAGAYRSLTDLYIAVLWPKGRDKHYDYVLYAKGQKAYAQNRGLDWNKDGAVTVGDVDRKLRNRFPHLYQHPEPAW